MEITDILNDLDIAIEGINSDTNADYRNLSKQVSDATKKAKSYMKSKKYVDAIKECDSAINKLNQFKEELKSSDAENKGKIAGNALVAAKTMAKSVLGTLAVLSTIKVGSKVLRRSNESYYGIANEKFELDLLIQEYIDEFSDAKGSMPQDKRFEFIMRVVRMIRYDVGFDRNLLKDTTDYLEKNYPNIKLWETHRGEMPDISTVTVEQFDEQTAQLRKNFSHERVQWLKEAGTRLYGEKKDASSEKSIEKTQDITSQEITSKKKSPILTGKNIGIATAGVGVVAALSSFIKNMASGKNANITNIIKGIDLSIKSLEMIKKQCQDSIRANESAILDDYISLLFDDDFSAEEAFLVGVYDGIFQYDSILESLISLGFDDEEACELYIEYMEI